MEKLYACILIKIAVDDIILPCSQWLMPVRKTGGKGKKVLSHVELVHFLLLAGQFLFPPIADTREISCSPVALLQLRWMTQSECSINTFCIFYCMLI